MESSIQVVVEEKDIDQLNHVNNSIYVVYLEEGRRDWFYKNGVNIEQVVAGGKATVVRKLVVLYHLEARLGDVLTIKTRPLKLGRTSFTFKQEIYNDRGQLINEAEALNVMVDLEKMESIPVVEEIAQHFR